MLDWFRDNKDALITIAALVISPVAVVIASIVSYRAVVTSQRIQREMARDTIRTTRAQITAGLFGTADHQWIVDFRHAIAEAFALGSKRFQTKRAGLARGAEGAEDRIELGRQLMLVTTEIQLMVSAKADGEELQRLITEMVFTDELAGRAEKAELVLAKARKLIEQREARLPSYLSGVAPTDIVAGPRP